MILVNKKISELGLQSNKKYFIFGCGKKFRELSQANILAGNILGVVDNNSKLWGTHVQFQGKDLPIYSLAEALKRTDSNTVYILALGWLALSEVIDQLKLHRELEETHIYMAQLLVDQTGYPNRRHVLPDSLRLTKNQVIPRIIHYCWFGGGKMPEEYRQYIVGWQEHNPNFEIRRWDESNFDWRKISYTKQAYEQGKWAFVSDYARMDVLYRYGGIYLDTDVEVIRPLEDLLYQEGFMGFEGNHVASGLGIGARKELSVIGEMRDIYRDLDFRYGPRKDMTICTDYETGILRQHGLVQNGELQFVEGLTVYPTEVLSGIVDIVGRPFVTKHTYTVHHYGGMWATPEDREKVEKVKKLYSCLIKGNILRIGVEFPLT